MKKVITTVIALLFSVVVFCQFQKTETVKIVTIGTVKFKGDAIAQLSFAPSDDTVFSLVYKDRNYELLTTYEGFDFKGGQQAVNDFYTALLAGYDVDKDTESNFIMAETSIKMITIQPGGEKYITLFIEKKGGGSGLMYLKKKELQSLFGK